jgi:nucleoid DNA-binding protein
MPVTKKDISKNIANKLGTSLNESQLILDVFLKILSSNINKPIKISSFGRFSKYKTKMRHGRNPKTLKSYIIESREKIKLNISRKVREKFN